MQKQFSFMEILFKKVQNALGTVVVPKAATAAKQSERGRRGLPSHESADGFSRNAQKIIYEEKNAG